MGRLGTCGMYWKRLKIRAHKDKGENCGSIYGLIDPLNNQLRYIGRTVRDPDKRFYEHASCEENRAVYRWTSSLKAAGMKPTMIIIEEALTSRQCDEAEHFWIIYFKSLGADLTNANNAKITRSWMFA